jgi:hypothetical protein
MSQYKARRFITTSLESATGPYPEPGERSPKLPAV